MKNKLKHLKTFKLFNEAMSQKDGESDDEYLKRLFAEGDSAVKNLDDAWKDIKSRDIIGFCKECGGNIYKDKKHKRI